MLSRLAMTWCGSSIIHPCKTYGAMAAGKLILNFGLSSSHHLDLLDKHQIAWHINHSDVASAVKIIRELRSTRPEVLALEGRNGTKGLARESRPIDALRALMRSFGAGARSQ